MARLTRTKLVFMLAATAALVSFSAGYSAGGNGAQAAQGRDVFGKPDGTNVQGGAGDKNAQGDRPEDADGNVPHDIYGNKTGK